MSQLNYSDVIAMTKEEATKWLGDLGLSVSGKREELLLRIQKYIRYPNLIDKLKQKASKHFTFQSSLDPTTIPSVNVKWQVSDDLLPTVSQKMFLSYAALKIEGSTG